MGNSEQVRRMTAQDLLNHGESMARIMLDEPKYEIEEVAAKLGVSRRTISSMLSDGRLFGVYYNTRNCKIPERALIKFMDDRISA